MLEVPHTHLAADIVTDFYHSFGLYTPTVPTNFHSLSFAPTAMAYPPFIREAMSLA